MALLSKAVAALKKTERSLVDAKGVNTVGSYILVAQLLPSLIDCSNEDILGADS
jgi:hypothetical protein